MQLVIIQTIKKEQTKRFHLLADPQKFTLFNGFARILKTKNLTLCIIKKIF